MLIWTNYVVVERGSVTDTECDKYCLCRNCQTDITHTHTYICITTYAFAQLHTLTYLHKCKARVLLTSIHTQQQCW